MGSLLFYAWGEPKIVFLMLLSIAANWLLGLGAEKHRGRRHGLKCIYTLSALFNFGLLFIFKYLNFSFDLAKSLLAFDMEIKQIALPIGISFFTFQAFSYVIDIGRGRATAQRNPIYAGLYISFFPQLIAGPIVRYESVASQLEGRHESFEKFSSGVEGFIIGFLKKVFLANSMALIADRAFEENLLSRGLAWLGVLAYALQIYHDFSAYSDMAVGLGLMFGFHLPENFNYPYLATSIRDFWRRWHISLGTWFRDYVYIPLGGSRVKSKARLLFNLLLVWFLTGLWHGADWTFILWGLYYFLLIAFEKLTDFDEKLQKLTPLKRFYSLFFVLMGWVLFRAQDLNGALAYYRAMFGPGVAAFDSNFWFYLRNFAPSLTAAAIFAFPQPGAFLERAKATSFPMRLAYAVGLGLLFLFALSYVVKGSYNPFIYFNF
jgi:alginate O-acetyltransferase complex protein AlgI